MLSSRVKYLANMRVVAITMIAITMVATLAGRKSAFAQSDVFASALPRVSFEEELGDYCQAADSDDVKRVSSLRGKVLRNLALSLQHTASVSVNVPIGTFLSSDAVFQIVADFCRMAKVRATTDLDAVYDSPERQKSAAEKEYLEAKKATLDSFSPMTRLLALTAKTASGLHDIEVVKRTSNDRGRQTSRLVVKKPRLSQEETTDLFSIMTTPYSLLSPMASLQDTAIILRDIEQVRVRVVGFALDKNNLRRCLSSVAIAENVDAESHSLPFPLKQSIIGWGSEVETLSRELTFRLDLVEEYSNYINSLIQAAVKEKTERDELNSIIRAFVSYRKIAMVLPEVDAEKSERNFATACNNPAVPSFDLWALQNPQSYPPELEVNGLKLARTLKVCGLFQKREVEISGESNPRPTKDYGKLISQLETDFSTFTAERYGAGKRSSFARDWGAPLACTPEQTNTPICIVRRIETAGKMPEAQDSDKSGTTALIPRELQTEAVKAAGAGIPPQFIRQVFQRLNTALEELALLRASIAEINVKRGLHKEKMTTARQCAPLAAQAEGEDRSSGWNQDSLTTQLYKGQKYIPTIVMMQRQANESYVSQAKIQQDERKHVELVNTLNFIQRILARKNGQENDILSKALQERNMQIPKGLR